MQAKLNPCLLFWEPILNEVKQELTSRFMPVPSISDNCELDDGEYHPQTDAVLINGCELTVGSVSHDVKDKMRKWIEQV